jgi:hypothetical protein
MIPDHINIMFPKVVYLVWWKKITDNFHDAHEHTDTELLQLTTVLHSIILY